MFRWLKRKVEVRIPKKLTEKQLREVFAYPNHPLLDGVNVLIDAEVADRINISMDVFEPREARDSALGGIEGLMSLRARIEDLTAATSDFKDAESVEPAPGA